jgi:hypothetical protein
MFYKILADITVFIHFLWILFLIFGAFAGVRSRVIKIFHISGIVLALSFQLLNWYCPLTYLEAWLRAQHSPAHTYTGSFIVHYMEKIVYLEVSRTMIFVLTVIIGVLNVGIYLKAVKRKA